MNTDRLHVLMQRYFSEEITLEETKELALMVGFNPDKRHLQQEFESLWHESSEEKSFRLSENDKQQILSSIFAKDKAELKTPQKLSRVFYIRVAAIAASLVLLVSVGVFVSHLLADKYSSSIIAKAIPVSPAQPTAYIRNLQLPDRSTVILQKGSTLEMKNDFHGNTREVILNGEAYFDIAHNKEKPFIIHTGDVKTTVLGTAFNIKAWPGQKKITVSVTRGRVRVENEQRVLAVLTVNQEVQYNIALANAKKIVVPTDKEVADWTRQDMNFDHSTLAEVAKVLGKRYGMHVEIKDPELSNVVLVTSFSGTESLQNVIDILRDITPNTRFTTNKQELVIAKIQTR
jgi:transmembrane sensor